MFQKQEAGLLKIIIELRKSRVVTVATLNFVI